MNENTGTQPAVRAGRVLGARYTLLSRIATGGMGEVWRVRDQRTGAVLAAKVLRPELTGEEISLSRLRLEAKNTVRARHPNIATVMDSGEDDGQGWIVMELIEGRPLTDYVGDGRRLSTAQLVPILTQVAYALDASNQAGVVHRDIKPANVMIRPDGIVKLTDFGISFAQGQANLTAAGMVMGTAQYLAPEQAMGGEASTAGDFYSLGVIAYEALAGSRPFTGKSPVEIAMAHVRDEIPPLPADVPESMKRVVFSLLAKDPMERPATGAALTRSLGSVAKEIGSQVGPTPLEAPEPDQEQARSGTQTKEQKKAPPRPMSAPRPGPASKPEPASKPKPAPRVASPERLPSRLEDTGPTAFVREYPLQTRDGEADPGPKWRPVRDAASLNAAPPRPTRPVGKALPQRSRHQETGAGRLDSSLGMWIIVALTVLTVILIVIAMVRDHSGADAPEALGVPAAVHTTEGPACLRPILAC